MAAVAAPVAAGTKRRERVSRADLPPLGPRLHLIRTVLVVVALLAAGLVLHVSLVSSVQQRASQQRLFDEFRAQLAGGTAPIGPTDAFGGPVETGTPVAYLEIPAIGVRQVVVEGTSSATLFSGPGHRRDTPLPGQAGVSVVFGRRTAFGGPFARIDQLDEGDEIRVTTGQGEFRFEVQGVRREGDPLPEAPSAGTGRLLLATADGPPLFPSGVLRVDAEMDDDAGAGPRRSSALDGAEQLLASDTSRLLLLALWLEALLLVAGLAVWAWHRWGRAQTWVVFVPGLLLVTINASGHAAELLPNLL